MHIFIIRGKLTKILHEQMHVSFSIVHSVLKAECKILLNENTSNKVFMILILIMIPGKRHHCSDLQMYVICALSTTSAIKFYHVGEKADTSWVALQVREKYV